MLEEFKAVRQEAAERCFRRWFVDEDMDLIVWYAEDRSITGFQLCYDKRGDEHAFTWRQDSGHVYKSHARIDNGEENPAKNNSPILVSDGHIPLERVLKEFGARALRLEPELASLVLERIRGFGQA